jgi:transposase InsO family protein
MRIRSDHGREFENFKFKEFCLSYGIKQEFSSLITPQQNEVVERKNREIQEMARVMIHSKNLAQHF